MKPVVCGQHLVQTASQQIQLLLEPSVNLGLVYTSPKVCTKAGTGCEGEETFGRPTKKTRLRSAQVVYQFSNPHCSLRWHCLLWLPPVGVSSSCKISPRKQPHWPPDCSAAASGATNAYQPQINVFLPHKIKLPLRSAKLCKLDSRKKSWQMCTSKATNDHQKQRQNHMCTIRSGTNLSTLYQEALSPMQLWVFHYESFDGFRTTWRHYPLWLPEGLESSSTTRRMYKNIKNNVEKWNDKTWQNDIKHWPWKGTHITSIRTMGLLKAGEEPRVNPIPQADLAQDLVSSFRAQALRSAWACRWWSHLLHLCFPFNPPLVPMRWWKLNDAGLIRKLKRWPFRHFDQSCMTGHIVRGLTGLTPTWTREQCFSTSIFNGLLNWVSVRMCNRLLHLQPSLCTRCTCHRRSSSSTAWMELARNSDNSVA